MLATMKQKRHLFALCAAVSCLACAAVFVKCAQIAETSVQIEKAEAQVRSLYTRPSYAPEVSMLAPDTTVAAVSFVAQIGN